MNAFTNISNETKTRIAMQMVIMDAIEKGHTDKSEMMAYMESETFRNAVQSYLAKM